VNFEDEDTFSRDPETREITSQAPQLVPIVRQDFDEHDAENIIDNNRDVSDDTLSEAESEDSEIAEYDREYLRQLTPDDVEELRDEEDN
jgi:hypothetical protein